MQNANELAVAAQLDEDALVEREADEVEGLLDAFRGAVHIGLA